MFLYHATDIKNLDSILKNGLITNPSHHNWDNMYLDEHIFLALDCEKAIDYAYNSDYEPEEIVVFKVDVDSLNSDEVTYDWNNRVNNFNEINSIAYDINIPPGDLEVVADTSAEPLQDIYDFVHCSFFEKIERTFEEEVLVEDDIDL